MLTVDFTHKDIWQIVECLELYFMEHSRDFSFGDFYIS